jgi:glycosyltransferase involved in cell wall biosynthesis
LKFEERLHPKPSMTSPKIAILNSIAQTGGAEMSLIELLRRSKENFEFHLILPEDGPLRRKAEEVGVTVWKIPWDKKITQLGEMNKKINLLKILQTTALIYPLARKVSRLLHDIKAQILITNGIKSHIIGAISHKRYPIPLIWYLRDGLEGRRISTKALGFYSSRASAAIVISHFLSKEARQLLSKSIPIHVLYNIVDFEKLQPGLSHPPDLVKGDGEIWFGMVGALTPLKGQDIFLRAADRVLNFIPNARFLIIGGNFYKTETSHNYEKDLKLQVQNSPLKDRVMFLGFRDDIPAVLSTLDVLIQPNRGPEGLGRSVLEAMACGVPVIAVNRWGPAELIQHSETGMLWSWMDIEDLTKKMILLGEQEDLRNRLGANAKEWVYKKFVPEQIVQQFQNILEDVISNVRHEV